MERSEGALEGIRPDPVPGHGSLLRLCARDPVFPDPNLVHDGDSSTEKLAEDEILLSAIPTSRPHLLYASWKVSK